MAVFQIALPGDLQDDDDVDLADFAGFQACYSGEGVAPVSADCLVYDFDEDFDVDLDDLGAFATAATGPLVGACCLPDGTCIEVGKFACQAAGGTYRGSGTRCALAQCPVVGVSGACCLSDGSCVELTETYCDDLGGSYQGAWTECATTECPYGMYSNEINPITNAAIAGAGLILADDMTLEGVGARELEYLDLAVYGNDGGTFSVTVNLYTDCPGAGGTLIPGTTATWADVPDDGYVYILTHPLSPTATIPDTVWMVAEFTTPQSAWIIAEEAEIGTTADLYGRNDPPWVCNYWFGADLYAGLWANLQCTEGGRAASGGDGGKDGQSGVPEVKQGPRVLAAYPADRQPGDGAPRLIRLELEQPPAGDDAGQPQLHVVPSAEGAGLRLEKGN